MIKKIILFFIAGILLLLLPVFFILCTDESGNGFVCLDIYRDDI